MNQEDKKYLEFKKWHRQKYAAYYITPVEIQKIKQGFIKAESRRNGKTGLMKLNPEDFI